MSALATRERRKDAHEKIQLGGLVVKAGLREIDPAIVLGALLYVRDLLDSGDVATIAQFRTAGIQSLAES